MKRSLLRVATLESGIITTTPATRAFFSANPTFHVNVIKDGNGNLRALFTSTTTGEQLKTSPLTNNAADLRSHWQGRYVRLTTANSVINIWFDRTRCVEMAYDDKSEKSIILCEGTYKGYEYKIISHPMYYAGRCPGAYIALSGKIAGLESYDDFPAGVHWGVSYLGSGEFLGDKKRYVGWDYSHGGDYYGECSKWEGEPEMAEYLSGLKKWTTEEILEEVYSAIDEIVEYDIKDIIIE